jgi:hypothetical protein
MIFLLQVPSAHEEAAVAGRRNRPIQLMFGGEDRRTLFVAVRSALYGVRPWMALVWASVLAVSASRSFPGLLA